MRRISLKLPGKTSSLLFLIILNLLVMPLVIPCEELPKNDNDEFFFFEEFFIKFIFSFFILNANVSTLF